MSCELKSNDELDIEERDKEIDRLERECDRLREALRAISINELDAARAQDIARAAL